MIDAASIAVSELPFVPLAERENLPPASGVYFVTSDSGIAYIGRANSLWERFRGNHNRQHQFEKLDNPRIHWQLASKAEMPSLEHVLIERFNPPLNNSPVGVSVAGTTTVYLRVPAVLYEWMKGQSGLYGNVQNVALEAIRQHKQQRT